MRCVMCGHNPLRAGTVDETVLVGTLRFIAQLPALVCPSCGEDLVSAETMRGLEQGVAEALACDGVRTPEAFRYMRKAIGLKAVDVAELLDVTPETVSRWENGERQPETRAAKLLGLMVLDYKAGRAEIQQYLRSLVKERTAPPTTGRRLHIPPQHA